MLGVQIVFAMIGHDTMLLKQERKRSFGMSFYSLTICKVLDTQLQISETYCVIKKNTIPFFMYVVFHIHCNYKIIDNNPSPPIGHLMERLGFVIVILQILSLFVLSHFQTHHRA